MFSLLPHLQPTQPELSWSLAREGGADPWKGHNEQPELLPPLPRAVQRCWDALPCPWLPIDQAAVALSAWVVAHPETPAPVRPALRSPQDTFPGAAAPRRVLCRPWDLEPVLCRRDRCSSQPCPFLLSLGRDLRGSGDADKVLTAIRRGCEGAGGTRPPSLVCSGSEGPRGRAESGDAAGMRWGGGGRSCREQPALYRRGAEPDSAVTLPS